MWTKYKCPLLVVHKSKSIWLGASCWSRICTCTVPSWYQCALRGGYLMIAIEFPSLVLRTYNSRFFRRLTHIKHSTTWHIIHKQPWLLTNIHVPRTNSRTRKLLTSRSSITLFVCPFLNYISLKAWMFIIVIIGHYTMLLIIIIISPC